MQAFHVLLFFIAVAPAAVNRGELGGMGKILSALQIAVTSAALREGGVGRGPQSRFVERRWDSRLALAGATAGIVAIQARLASR